jgi:hypothetical protein
MDSDKRQTEHASGCSYKTRQQLSAIRIVAVCMALLEVQSLINLSSSLQS